MEEITDKVKRLNKKPEIIQEIVIENEDEIITNSIYDNGLNDGISKGIEQRNIDIAKNLLNESVDIEIISKTTGLTKDTIESLK